MPCFWSIGDGRVAQGQIYSQLRFCCIVGASKLTSCSLIYNYSLSGETWFTGLCFHTRHVIQKWVKHHVDPVVDIILMHTGERLQHMSFQNSQYLICLLICFKKMFDLSSVTKVIKRQVCILLNPFEGKIQMSITFSVYHCIFNNHSYLLLFRS